MKLDGSCHCGSVRFSVVSAQPYPFNLCYCSVCRKTAGGGGYAINLGADFHTLHVEGDDCIGIYQARIPQQDSGDVEISTARRHFCTRCGSALWAWDPRWPELIHPFASAIDTDLPVPSERTHMMLSSKPAWVAVCAGISDKQFDRYPSESLAEWHARRELAVGDY